MLTLIAGLLLFFGMHSISIVSRTTRDSLASRLGPVGWRVLYSLVSLAGFYLIVRGYSLARQDPLVLYTTPHWMRYVSAVLMLPVFPLLIAAYAPGRIKAATKHPMLVATKSWALAHLLVNGALADVLLFGGFLVWAVADRIAVGRRPAPVRPMFGGKERSRSTLADTIAVVLGLAIYAWLFMSGHARLFGVTPAP